MMCDGKEQRLQAGKERGSGVAVAKDVMGMMGTMIQEISRDTRRRVPDSLSPGPWKSKTRV